MATYSVWQSFITDGGEKVVPSAEITVYLESSGAVATLYSTETGTVLANPFTAGADGFAQFFAPAGVYKVTARKDALEKSFRFVQLGTAASRDAGQPSGIATLDGDALVPSEQVPSYAFANLAAFPATGALGKIYLARDTGKLYTPVAGGGAGYDQVAPGLSPIADNTLLGNISGVTAAPVALTVAQIKSLLNLPTEIRLTADVVVTSASTLPLATIPVVAGRFYEVEFTGAFSATLDSVGAFITLDPGTSETGAITANNTGAGFALIPSGTTTAEFANQFDVSSGGLSYTTSKVAIASTGTKTAVFGKWVFKAVASGAVTLRFGAETTGSTHTMKAGISGTKIWERT